MTPIGEILVRDIIMGKKYCREKFDKEVPVAWAADGFGLNAQMPQIYKKSGYRWLAFRRGLPKTIGYRVSEFNWEGLDGSSILSHWMPLGYRAGLDLDKWPESYKVLSEYATTLNILMPCGSGGVPPQADTLEKVEQWNNEHTDSNMIVSLPSQFFEALEKESTALAEYRGEMYSQELGNVFPDVVSSRISLKMGYKACENALITAEKMATIAWIKNMPYPSDMLLRLLKEMLFLADHDVVSCCGIDEIYGEAWEYIHHIQEASHNIITQSVNHLLQPNEKGQFITVINPNIWEVTDWVEAEVTVPPDFGKTIGISFNGNEIPCQMLGTPLSKGEDTSIIKLGFMATVPPVGHRVYNLIKTRSDHKSKIEVKNNEVTNRFFRVSIDDKTGIISVFRHNGRKILEGNELVIDQEIGDLYFHKSEFDTPISTESGKGIHFSTFVPEGISIEKGPIRTVITYKSAFYCLQWPYYLTEKFGSVFQRHKTIEVTKQVIIYNDIPRIGFKTTIKSEQSHIRMRVKFDTCMVVPEYTRQTQFGVIDLPSSRTLEHSVRFPSLNWINCQEGNHGIAFFSRGVPINEVFAGHVYCTLLRSVSVLSSDGMSGPLIPTPEAMELGEHEYTYAVYIHEGDWKKANVHLHGHSFNHRLIALQTTEAANTESSAFKLEPDNLIVSALKQAENGKDIILRFFETCGESCHAVLHLPPEIKSVESVDLIENDGKKISIKNQQIKLDVSPFEIVTLRLSF